MASMNFVATFLSRSVSDPVKTLVPVATEVVEADPLTGGTGGGSSCFPEKTTEDLCDKVIKKYYESMQNDFTINRRLLGDCCFEIFFEYSYVNGSVQDEFAFGDLVTKVKKELFIKRMRNLHFI